MVTAAVETKRYTVDDLADIPDDGRIRELVDGQILDWGMTSVRHASLESLLTIVIGNHVRERRLGRVMNGEGTVSILGSANHARLFDVAFYRRGRLPRDVDAAATTIAPDLVIEILSPTDRVAMVEAKIDDWLRTGVVLLWYINPQTGTTTVYHEGTIRRVLAGELLTGCDVLPGLQLRLQDLLDELVDDEE
ncbi:MAG: Uma2 family endonuclease [Chloroflexota bacterium]